MLDYLTLAGYLRSNGVTSPAQCELLITTLLIERPSGTNPPPLTPPLTHADYFDLAGYIRDNGVTSPAQCEQLITTLLLERPIGSLGPVFPAGATHYWPANALGTSPDLIGGVNLVAGAGVTLETGPLDNALGVNNAVANWWAATASISNLTPNSAWSLSFWFNSAVFQNSFPSIGQYTDFTLPNKSFIVDIGDSINTIDFAISSGAAQIFLDYPTGGKDADGNWHNLVFTQDTPGGTISCYLDGVLAGTGTRTIGANASNFPFVIGQPIPSAPMTLIKISDVGSWLRALTTDEITTLYNSGTPLRP